MLFVTSLAASAYTLSPLAALTPAAQRSAPCAAAQVATARRCDAPLLQFDMGKMGGDFMKKMGVGGSDSGLSEEESKAMEERLRQGDMSFDDFLKQVQVMQKTAGLQSMLNKGPFGGGAGVTDDQVREGQKKLTRYGDYVESMDAEERTNPTILIDEATSIKGGNSLVTAPRLQRIAEATDATIDDVGRFVMEFSTMRTAAVRFARGDDPEDIKRGMMAEQNADKPPPNRKMRRMAAKKKKTKPAATGGFGKR